ncbi:acyltransferase family protein [Pseudomonas sp. yb_1]|uniref:acyltransferase family protein n=1 Tax=Pseudomonas sp. yb_1 TaxID=3367217 RepID=UPI00370BEED1
MSFENHSQKYVPTPLGYRPDIEGLRALAVTLVLLYHAGVTQISGGFIGVDIFFVISGFLISRIIYIEILNNSFTFTSFYTRRLKRIFPLLVVVIAATSAAAYNILAPADLKSYATSVVASLFSVSNILFWSNEGGYFAQSAAQIPLTHTWSLSVEEQFYLIMPAVLLLSFKLTTPGKRAALFLSAFLLSLAYSAYSSYYAQASSYYLITSRAFELLFGAGLAFIWNRLPAFRAIGAGVMRTAALTLIIVTALFIDASTPFPGFAAIVPCLSAAILIACGKTATQPKGLSYFLLSNPLITYVGKLSYSLYLWHWPIVALVNYQGIQITWSVTSQIILVSVALSVASYHLIESPIRHKKNVSFKYAFSTAFAIPTVIAISGLVLTNATDGFKFRLSAELQGEFSSSNSPGALYKECFNSYKLDNFDTCFVGINSKPAAGMFIGDSMAGHYVPFMNALAKDAGIKLITSSASGLPPFHVKNYDYFKQQRTEKALAYNDNRIEMSMNYPYVFIAASWAQGYPYLSENEKDLLESISRYIKNGTQVYLITRPNTITDKIVSDIRTKRMAGENISNDRAPFKDSNKFLRTIAQKYPSVKVIDPNKIICPDTSCIVSIDNQTMYLDSAHINVHASEKLGERYIQQFGNPLKAIN